MKKPVSLIWLVIFTSCMTGSTSPRDYFVNRGRDAADIFTATVGMGAGAKVRVGPINLGAFANIDMGGLRGGQYKNSFSSDFNPNDLTLTVISLEKFEPYPLDVCMERKKFFVSQGYAGITLAGTDARNYRFKNGNVFPPSFAEPTWTKEIIPYYTQIEAAIGLGGTLRLGFNPGELFDFILGWTTLDIFNDDIE